MSGTPLDTMLALTSRTPRLSLQRENKEQRKTLQVPFVNPNDPRLSQSKSFSRDRTTSILKRLTSTDFDTFGREVLAKNQTAGEEQEYPTDPLLIVSFMKLNFPTASRGGQRHNSLNAVFQHPGTGAQFYIGNYQTADTRAVLAAHNITRVVNCTDATSINAFESGPKKDTSIKYLRFLISKWWKAKRGVLEYFALYFGWVDAQLAEGRSVLVHCLAGAHRAGTAGIAYVMHASGLSLTDAVSVVQYFRPIVDPIGTFPELLSALDRALAKVRTTRLDN